VLDDRTPSELLPCLGSKEIFAIYQEVRLVESPTTLSHSTKISRLEKQLERLHTTIDAILSLAEQLKEAAIEKVLGKSALESFECTFREAKLCQTYRVVVHYPYEEWSSVSPTQIATNLATAISFVATDTLRP